MSASSGSLDELLEAARRAEKEQTILYRRLAAAAERQNAAELAQRFHDLHADEQHHLSRLTARLLELGARPGDLADVTAPAIALDAWKAVIPGREEAEIERYRSLLERDLDPLTRELVQDILSVEEHHRSELGGKWTRA
jgi:rubrerythrin